MEFSPQSNKLLTTPVESILNKHIKYIFKQSLQVVTHRRTAAFLVYSLLLPVALSYFPGQ